MQSGSLVMPVERAKRAGGVTMLVAMMVLAVAPPVSAGTARTHVRGPAAWGYVRSLNAGVAEAAAAEGPCVRHINSRCLYSIGGGSDIHFNKTVMMYSPRGNRWKTVAHLKRGRGNSAATSGPCVGAVRETCVYLISGQNSFEATTEVDMFNPARNSWRTVSSMHQARASLAAATAPCLRAAQRACLYAFGGLLDNQSDHPLATVEMFSPYTNSWRFGPSLPAAATELAAASGRCGSRESRRCLYALGGMNSAFHVVGSVFRLDPTTEMADQGVYAARPS